ncbi:hypothetical protein LX32DRAFT_294897 [Colletotrichum zoysiae]|uniref:Uncharacterized protein n=1 Tax=Colletotrichum zoysiae TaxID=1216348 RepID=A0AAD9H282_9PEZI|nr:hypothetical protein LX32DRAFT_294897 [Colletotrichum zoysiae]
MADIYTHTRARAPGPRIDIYPAPRQDAVAILPWTTFPNPSTLPLPTRKEDLSLSLSISPSSPPPCCDGRTRRRLMTLCNVDDGVSQRSMLLVVLGGRLRRRPTGNCANRFVSSRVLCLIPSDGFSEPARLLPCSGVVASHRIASSDSGQEDPESRG